MAEVTFDLKRGPRFPVRFGRRKSSAWVPCRGEADREEKNDWGSPAATNLAGEACRWLRSPTRKFVGWRRSLREKRKETREGVSGLL
jgi:hypothetical protein